MKTKILAFFALFLSFVGLVGGICYLFYYKQPAIAIMQLVVGTIYVKQFFPVWWKTLTE